MLKTRCYERHGARDVGTNRADLNGCYRLSLAGVRNGLRTIVWFVPRNSKLVLAKESHVRASALATTRAVALQVLFTQIDSGWPFTDLDGMKLGRTRQPTSVASPQVYLKFATEPHASGRFAVWSASHIFSC
jgi:hypothetical protein